MMQQAPFSVSCAIDQRTGKIISKTEHGPRGKTTFNYGHDNAGRLKTVSRNGNTVERYDYNNKGQRVRGESHGTAAQYEYDRQGRLQAAGRETYRYDKNGNLASRTVGCDATEFKYRDALLKTVRWPHRQELIYTYDADSKLFMHPTAKYHNAVLVGEYYWEEPGLLACFVDYKTGLKHSFAYDEKHALSQILLERHPPHEPPRKRGNVLYDVFGKGTAEVLLLCGCD